MRQSPPCSLKSLQRRSEAHVSNRPLQSRQSMQPPSLIRGTIVRMRTPCLSAVTGAKRSLTTRRTRCIRSGPMAPFRPFQTPIGLALRMTGRTVTLRLINPLVGETRVATSISGRCADATRCLSGYGEQTGQPTPLETLNLHDIPRFAADLRGNHQIPAPACCLGVVNRHHLPNLTQRIHYR